MLTERQKKLTFHIFSSNVIIYCLNKLHKQEQVALLSISKQQVTFTFKPGSPSENDLENVSGLQQSALEMLEKPKEKQIEPDSSGLTFS